MTTWPVFVMGPIGLCQTVIRLAGRSCIVLPKNLSIGNETILYVMCCGFSYPTDTNHLCALKPHMNNNKNTNSQRFHSCVPAGAAVFVVAANLRCFRVLTNYSMYYTANKL